MWVAGAAHRPSKRRAGRNLSLQILHTWKLQFHRRGASEHFIRSSCHSASKGNQYIDERRFNSGTRSRGTSWRDQMSNGCGDTRTSPFMLLDDRDGILIESAPNNVAPQTLVVIALQAYNLYLCHAPHWHDNTVRDICTAQSDNTVTGCTLRVVCAYLLTNVTQAPWMDLKWCEIGSFSSFKLQDPWARAHWYFTTTFEDHKREST